MVFSQNAARLGSTIHLEKFPFIFTGMQVRGVGVKGCTFTGNSMHYLTRPEGETESDPYPVGDGRVYAHAVPMSFIGNMTFQRNNGSGLSVAKPEANFSNCSASFFRNTGTWNSYFHFIGECHVMMCAILRPHILI